MCELLDKYWNGGMAQGKTESILDLLADIGAVPQNLKEQITKEKDLDVLSKWLKWAARANSIAEFEAKLS